MIRVSHGNKLRIQTSVKLLSLLVMAMMTTPISQADTVPTGGERRNVGDLEIYQAATGGQINLMMMLDTSGSMGISSLVLPTNNQYGSPGDVTSPLCAFDSVTEYNGSTGNTIKEWQYNAKDMRSGLPTYNKTSFYKEVTINGTKVPYYLRGCSLKTDEKGLTIDATGKLVETNTAKFDRLSRLKDALITLLANDKISNDVAMGLGHFSSKTPLTIGNTTNKLVDGHSGRILVPTAKLTPAQRLKLAQAIAQFQSVDTTTNQDGTPNANLRLSSSNYPDILKSSSGTPTAHAYAEAGAYMMGTGTGVDPNPATQVQILYDGYAIQQNNDDANQKVYYVCVGLGSYTSGFAGAEVKQCDNAWNGYEIYDGVQNGTWYDSNNQQIGANIRVYRPDGAGGWTRVTPAQLKALVGPMTSAWQTHAKLPVGWRYGGWMKVDNEPLDIEPINATPWGNPGGSINLVAYRASPFSVKVRTTEKNTTERKLTYDDCPYGFTLDQGWPSLCYQQANSLYTWYTYAPYKRVYDSRNRRYVNEYYCDRSVSPAKGSDPLRVYEFGSDKNPTGNIIDDHANTGYWKIFSSYGTYYCSQQRYYVARPASWKTITTTTTTTTPVDNNYGGIAYSATDTKNSAGDQYIRGATTTGDTSAQCNSNGIYFLTDGAPNSTKDEMAKTIINKSLNDDVKYTITAKPTDGLVSPSLTSGLFDGETGGWEWIGEYAKRLYNKDTNPSGVSIRTAVAGFGASFAGLNKNTDGTYNCDTAGATQDAKNACKWGEKGAGYGEGGFFYAQSSEDIANSITTFIASLNNTIPAAPSGTLTIPKDPYRPLGELPVAYLPSLESQLSGGDNLRNIWPGNIKKFDLFDGTLYGKDNQKLFKDVSGNLAPTTKDLWQSLDYINDNGDTRNDAVQAGGMYEQLTTPSSNVKTTRSVWVEDLQDTDTNTTATTLRRLSVDDSKHPSGFDTLKDTTTYSRANQIKLLQFMGYTQAYKPNAATPTDLDQLISDTTPIKDLTMAQPTQAIKVLGASIHSKPVAVSYEATLENGRVKNISDDSARKDYVLFGTMDGGLHMVKSDSGEEQFVVIPRIMMQTQSDAIVPNSVYTTTAERPAATPYFGIDGQWAVRAKYNYNYKDNKVGVNSSDGMYAYGGMRLGGKGLLGFNLSNSNLPAPAFNGSRALIDSSVTGFGRIGYIWNPPSLARIKTSATDKQGTDVVIFGGGYDMCYENEYFQIGVTATTQNGISATCAGKTQADGNAVYIINAKTGALLWSATYNASASGSFDGKKYMKHSIVGGITVLDRDNDGYADQLYFADLGGQVFRADFKDGIVASNKGRVVRILKDDKEGTSYARRFYERPNVSFYRNTETGQGNKLFAVVNVISGDRSSPLSKMRDTVENADRVYGVFDTDVTIGDARFYASDFTPAIKDLVVKFSSTNSKQASSSTMASDSKLVKLGVIGTGDLSKDKLKQTLYSFSAATPKRGWFYPLTKFDGFENVKYSKGVGKSEVIAGKLYTTVYNPDMNYSASDACSAKIEGGSERQLYCMPWGVCDDAISTNGTGGYERAGQGIQELAFGPQSGSADQVNRRLMIGTLGLNELKDTARRTSFGDDTNKNVSSTTDPIGLQNQPQTTNMGIDGGLTKTLGSGSADRVLIEPRYRLTPQRWYEK